MMLPVRIALAFCFCLFSLQADIIANATCVPVDQAIISANGCDVSVPGVSVHASFGYSLPDTSGFSIGASAFADASFSVPQLLDFSVAATSHARLDCMYLTLGPVRPGFALVRLTADGNSGRPSMPPNGAGGVRLWIYGGGWNGAQCPGCFSGYVPFTLGIPFELTVGADASVFAAPNPSCSQCPPGSVVGGGSAS